MARRAATIGVQAFCNKIPERMNGILIYPSSPAIAMNQVIPLANSIVVPNALPMEFDSVSKKVPKVLSHIKDAIAGRLHQNTRLIITNDSAKDKDSPGHERNRIGHTVLQEINLALGSMIEDKTISIATMSNMAIYGEIRLSAALSRDGTWYQINGRPDFAIYGAGHLPATSRPPKGSENTELSALFDVWLNDVIDGAELRGVEKADEEGVKPFNNRKPNFASGFYSYKDHPVLLPSINVCIDNKLRFFNQSSDLDFEQQREIYVGQGALYLLTNAIAGSFYSRKDDPFMTLGLVTDGNSFTFLAFQLNTLDFDSKTTKNIFWRKDMRLFSGQTFNEATWTQLKEFISYPITAKYKGGRQVQGFTE